MSEKQNVRINYSAGRKVSAQDDFGSYDFHVSMSRDVEEDTPEAIHAATKECVEYVQSMLAHKVKQANKGKLKY